MTRCRIKAAAVILILSVCIGLNGCAGIPLTEDGLQISKDTTAGIDDIGVGRVTRQF